MNKILILDFGSQYTQLIARRIRELGVYSEIQPFNYSLEKIKEFAPKGIILSGGPASVMAEGAPRCDKAIFSLGIPVLGICYGLQLMAFLLGGEVEEGIKCEYGPATIRILKETPLFKGFPPEVEVKVWMSHGDRVIKLPPNFFVLAASENSPVAAMGDEERHFYGVQFHPEVVHTPRGKEILSNFLFHICKCEADWSMGSFIEQTVPKLKERVGESNVVCALSGGVDSSVVAVLLHRAIGNKLHTIFVNNGLLRAGEAEEVQEVFTRQFPLNFHYVDASALFLERLRGVTDPEEKRKIIGNLFIDIFEEEAKKIGNVEFLAQGTLYPDVIESVSFKGPAATIKSHHNVGALPERMQLKLIEPLRELFKDEVRVLGKELGLPEFIIKRQPFPGPGLAIRIIGEITPERLEILRAADKIVLEEIRRADLYDKVWQSFAVLLPIKTVGVMGDERTYEHVIALRVVESLDGMTADWGRLPYDLLSRISNRIINEVKGINRVVYDISSKPPSTIEWE
ncbi:MAG: glutamine-hydrolyzing GMP synthase [Candidatus Desulfofervidaceae bacterium]|nr:glutamine-hydrolyzing GMP synthase [Candidatus Desulfofervidaceae bacterium]